MHAFQGVVGAALQADVHVGGELLVLEKCKKSVAELVGLDGGDPDSEVAVNIQDVLNELLEVGAFVLVASHVDSSQHDFLEAVGDDLAYVVIDVLGRAARGASSHHRDDAVGAEVVAAIMDLDEAAGMEGVEGRLVAEQVAVVTLRVAVACAEMLVDDVEQGRLSLVVDDKVGDAGLQQFLFSVVDHAAGDGNQCLGMLASDLVDGLATFLVAGVGDGAGVHDKDVGIGIAVGDVVARSLEARCQSVSLIQVDTTSQSLERYFLHRL